MIRRRKPDTYAGKRSSRRAAAPLAIAALIALTLSPSPGSAQVEIQRRGEENPVLTVSKSTIYGGLAGLVLGGALALAVNENEGDIVKWFFVAGTFGGFGAGVYHVTHRPGPTSALLTITPGGVGTALPALELSATRSEGAAARITLLSAGF